jgi:hypothetical protein
LEYGLAPVEIALMDIDWKNKTVLPAVSVARIVEASFVT